MSRINNSEQASQIALLDVIENEVKTIAGLGLLSPNTDDLTTVWRAKAETESSRFINDDFSINRSRLSNFRRLMIFGDDLPSWQGSKHSLRNLLGSGHRGRRKILRDCLEVLKACGYEELAGEHPCPPAGNPQLFQHQGHQYTFRWLKHIYFVGLMNEVLRSRLN